MSYFNQEQSGYFDDLGFTYLNLVTPMVADIVAIQQLYGLSTTTRSGNTTYGYNSNAGNQIYNANVGTGGITNVALTIFDTGGTDTLDYSGSNAVQRIDLNPESFSNILGQTGNLSIARGTIIENAIGGTGADIIIGNAVNNTLSGNAGNDQLFGNAGADILTGNSGLDMLIGGSGADTFRDTRAGLNGDTITDFRAGDKIILTDATFSSFAFNVSGSTLTYSGGTVTLTNGVTGGTLVASAASGGGVQLTIQVRDVADDFNGDGHSDLLFGNSGPNASVFTNWLGQPKGSLTDNSANLFAFLPPEWKVAGTGDFNGDGRDDILWGNTGDEASVFTNWLGQESGGLLDNSSNLYAFLPSEWQVAGTGDFNGDGRDDVLWQNTGDVSVFTNWLGQSNGSLADNSANFFSFLEAEWHIAATGDFNGDGRDDILWQRDGGAFTNWLGKSNGGFTDNSANFFAFLGAGWTVAGAGDFNGDGRDDILWKNSSGDYTNWLGQANGSFVDNSANFWANPGAQFRLEAIGDYNGDGRDDVVWGHQNGGLFTNWLGQANGNLIDNSANFFAFVPPAWQIHPDAIV
jgi:hypothetical protein